MALESEDTTRTAEGPAGGTLPRGWRCDPRLYVILDPEHSGGHELGGLATKAAEGGASLFQLRVKTASAKATLTIARECLAALAPFGVPLLINDRVDIALAAGAQGVHLGQDDLPVAEARGLLGPDALIGLTVRSLDEARAAPVDLVDYVSIGGVFPTRSKTGVERYVGLDGLAAIAAALPAGHGLPLCAISGITADNADQVIAAGVDGVAVITAVSKAPDPAVAAAELWRVVEAAQAGSAAT